MRDRTADLLRAKQALSQLSYSPIVVIKPLTLHSDECNFHSGRAQCREAYFSMLSGAVTQHE